MFYSKRTRGCRDLEEPRAPAFARLRLLLLPRRRRRAHPRAPGSRAAGSSERNPSLYAPQGCGVRKSTRSRRSPAIESCMACTVARTSASTRAWPETVGGWHPSFARYRRWGHTEHSCRFVRAGLAPPPFNVAERCPRMNRIHPCVTMASVALEDVLRPEVERLRTLTGHSFATWSF
jgi:hypothetical protein